MIIVAENYQVAQTKLFNTEVSEIEDFYTVSLAELLTFISIISEKKMIIIV